MRWIDRAIPINQEHSDTAPTGIGIVNKRASVNSIFKEAVGTNSGNEISLEKNYELHQNLTLIATCKSRCEGYRRSK